MTLLPVSLLSIERARFPGSLLYHGRNSVVLGAKSDQGRFDALQLLGVSLAGIGVAGQRFEDLQRDGLLNAAKIVLGLFGQTMRLAIPATCFFR